MSDDSKSDQNKPVDPDHAKRFLDLVRGALNTPVTEDVKEEEREHEQAEKERTKAIQNQGN